VTIGDTGVTSIKLTGGGLPDLGASSTYGVAELAGTILVNVGDRDSDLAGGHARRAFKLPNPMYYIP
jgi:HAD superfamily, subfamily IIIB (Acid phosphatase)